jgi:hypothetical protein
MIKDCDPSSGQKIVHDLLFVGWGIVTDWKKTITVQAQEFVPKCITVERES